MNESTQIIILAGGKGTRMGGELPKALVNLGEKTLTEHVLDSVKQASDQQPIVVVGYKAELVRECLGDVCHYALQEEQKGTGHAVMCAQDLIASHIDTILILYADQPFVSPDTMHELVARKQKEDAKIVIATIVVKDDALFHNQFFNFGRIVRDEAGEITRIVETKDASEEEMKIREVNPAYFCLDKAWMLECLKNLKNTNAQGEYYLTDLVQMAFDQGHTIHSVQIDTREALGANTKEQLEVLHNHL